MNRLRQQRLAAGLTQAELANHAGISRTAVTSIEGERLVPSVESALALAKALGTTVESLFGAAEDRNEPEVWALPRSGESTAYWRAEVMGRSVRYPVTTSPSLSFLPDGDDRSAGFSAVSLASETLVMASCDPASGFLASLYAASSGLRLITLQSSSRNAVDLLRQGLVHVAGLHLSTQDAPQQNIDVIRESLGDGYQVVRLARWQSGIALKPTSPFRTVRSLINGKANWIGRENGSGARECMNRVLGKKFKPQWTASSHRSVADAIAAGWADAGICTELVSAEANLKFLPVQEEYFDLCFPTANSNDRRVKTFINVIRSTAYRNLLANLPGYDSTETGDLSEIKN